MDKKNCQGCEQNFYNGNNPYGIEECWSFKTAKLIMRKKVSIDQMPPWEQEAEEYPSCYQVKRFIFVRPEVVR